MTLNLDPLPRMSADSVVGIDLCSYIYRSVILNILLLKLASNHGGPIMQTLRVNIIKPSPANIKEVLTIYMYIGYLHKD